MKTLYKKKSVEEFKFEKLKYKDTVQFNYYDWKVQTYNNKNIIVLTRKDQTMILTLIKSCGDVSVSLHRGESNDGESEAWVDNLSSFGLVTKVIDVDGGFIVGKNTKVKEMKFAPVEVGDVLYTTTRHYGVTVQFVSKDGSLVAWDGDKNESYYVNRNDRDQIRSLNLKLL